MIRKLFKTEDVLKAYPWISAATLHHRVKKNSLPIRHRSRTRGVANEFTEPELVHCGVVDILASMGLLIDKERVLSSLYGYKLRKLVTDFPDAGPLEFWPFESLAMLCDFYEAYNYNVIVSVRIEYERRPTHRGYSVTYIGQDSPDPGVEQKDPPDPADEELKHWREVPTYGGKLAIGFIDVRRVWEECDFGLGFRLSQE
jgi:hypothetical protein